MATTLTYEELHKKTVAELREIAKGLTHEAVQGYTQMNKEHLLPAICQAFGIDTHSHHHLESGFDKAKMKARMRELRRQRERAAQSGDSSQLHTIRREWHTLNHRIRAHTV
jgi:hypothetical protein